MVRAERYAAVRRGRLVSLETMCFVVNSCILSEGDTVSDGNSEEWPAGISSVSILIDVNGFSWCSFSGDVIFFRNIILMSSFVGLFLGRADYEWQKVSIEEM